MQAEAKPIANCDHKPPFTSYTFQEQNGETFFLSSNDNEQLHSKCSGYEAKSGEKVEEEQPSIINPETNDVVCLALTCRFNQLDLDTAKKIPHELVEILLSN